MLCCCFVVVAVFGLAGVKLLLRLLLAASDSVLAASIFGLAIYV
jgi:hypothetical protein